jgi:hypothetical protein
MSTAQDAAQKGDVIVRFSEVHWYEVKVPRVELEEAFGEDAVARLPGLRDEADDIPDEVTELLTIAAVDQDGALWQVDGREIGTVRLAEG